MQLPPFLTRVSGPSFSSKQDGSVTYDYSGLDDHIKRQDAVGGMRDSKYASLYSGDVASGVTARNKIRDLLSQVRQFNPDATERNPGSTVAPLARVASTSSGSSSSQDSGSIEGSHGGMGSSVSPYRPQGDRPAPQAAGAAPPAPPQSQPRVALPVQRRNLRDGKHPLVTDVLGYSNDMSGQV